MATPHPTGSPIRRLAPAAAGVALALVGCSGNSTAKVVARTTTAAPSSSAAATGGARATGTAPAAAAASASIDAGTLSGTGYSFTPPPGYADATAATTGSAVRIDEAIARAPEGGFATNINVIRETTGGAVTLDDVANQFQAQVSRLSGHAVTQTDTMLGGQPARAEEVDASPTTHGRQVFAVRGDAVFTVTFTSSKDRFIAEVPQFEQFLATWQFSS